MISSYLSILHTKWLKRHKQLAKFTKIPENFSQMQNMQIYVAKRTRTLRTNFQSNASVDKWLIACVVTDADRRKCTKKICKVNAATRKNMIRVKKCAHTEMKNRRAFLLFFSCFALFWVCLGDASHICHGKHTHIYHIENVVQMMQLHNAFVFLFCISFICILIIRGTRVVLEDSFFRFSVTNHLDFGVSLHSNRRLCEEAV